MADTALFQQRQKTHAMIVTSNGGLRRNLEEGLTGLGYGVCTACDGESSLAKIKQHRVDVAVTSYDLLGMNGIQLTRAITRIHPNVPVILLSTRPDPNQVAQALSSGAADLVNEDLTGEELHTIIQCNLERKVAPTRRILTDRAETLFKIVRVVTAAIDAKSHYAARHSSHVTYLSLLIGKRLLLSTEEAATLELAAQLHDIGKIGTPEAVLTKPDTLTDDEWVDVLKHPTLGSAFLSGVPELSEIAAIVRHHHEHWDGTGYPDGLQGQAIPLFSRIIAVADAYDAMTSERPYRDAKPHGEAIQELLQYSGKQFDPEMVDHLIAATEEYTERRAA